MRAGLAARVNPVLAREMIQRTRSARVAWILFVWASLLTGVLVLAHIGLTDGGSGFGIDDLAQSAEVGHGLFGWLLTFMLLLVLFLVPAQTAATIAGERERQTLVPLQLTLLRPRSILLGKLAASLSFLVLLMVSALPLLSVSLLLGGVTLADVLGGVAAVLVAGVLVGALCVAVSSMVRSVQAATVLSYGLVLMLTVGTVVFGSALAVIDASRGTDSTELPRWALAPNPVALVASAAGEPLRFSRFDTPLDGLAEFLDRRDGDVVFDDFGRVERTGGPAVRFWVLSTLTLTSMAVAASGFALRRLQTPAPVER